MLLSHTFTMSGSDVASLIEFSRGLGGDSVKDGRSNISVLGATLMLNFHRVLGAIFVGLGAS